MTCNTSAETLREYIYVCAGCGLLDAATRRDQMTCSGACRVRAHRSGELRRLREDAKEGEIRPAGILQAAAVARLAPELGDRIMQGELSLDEAQRLMLPAFRALVARAVRAINELQQGVR
jgi:hypothetical protein